MSELLTIFGPNAQHLGDHNGWERKSKEGDEITFTIAGKCLIPQFASNDVNPWGQ